MSTIVTNTGLERIASITADDLNFLAVGTTETSLNNGQTQLVEETHREEVTQTLKQGSIFQVRALFANADLPSSVTEMGAFLNGNASANTGSMLIRAIETFTKGDSDLLLTVEVEFEEN